MLAEETGEHGAGRRGEAATSGRGRVWVVDPLDGTVNYANGIPFFCVSIALVVDGRPTVGVVHDPTRLETFAATAGGPAMLTGALGSPAARSPSRTRRSSPTSSSRWHSTGGPRRRGPRRVRKAIRDLRNMGSAALELAYVANGRFDAFVLQGGLSTWDIAAAGLIAERGGATVTSLDGGPWFDVAAKTRTIGVLAAPPAHHAAFLALAR